MRQFRRDLRLGHAQWLVEHPGDLLQRGTGGLERVVELRQVLQRVEEALQVQQERGEHAHLDVAVRHAQPPVQQHGARAQVGDQSDPR